MRIGNHDVDKKLFEGYVRLMRAERANPLLEYDDARWKVHCQILESVGFEHRGGACVNVPRKLSKPTRAGKTYDEAPAEGTPPELADFDSALSAAVELFLED